MNGLFWMAVLVLGLVLAVIGAVVRLRPLVRRRGRDADLGKLPLTPLQRRAWWGLAIGLVWSVALLWVVLRTDPITMMESHRERILFTLVLLGGILAYGGVMIAMRPGRSHRVVIDERDRTIKLRAMGIQSGMTLASLLIWTVALTEAYWGEGAIPVAYPSLIFWSTFVVFLVTHSAGILLGYALWGRDAAEG